MKDFSDLEQKGKENNYLRVFRDSSKIVSQLAFLTEFEANLTNSFFED